MDKFLWVPFARVGFSFCAQHQRAVAARFDARTVTGSALAEKRTDSIGVLAFIYPSGFGGQILAPAYQLLWRVRVAILPLIAFVVVNFAVFTTKVHPDAGPRVKYSLFEVIKLVRLSSNQLPEGICDLRFHRILGSLVAEH